MKDKWLIIAGITYILFWVAFLVFAIYTTIK
jgi:hypothetical protein